jgi:hypothetical protein
MNAPRDDSLSPDSSRTPLHPPDVRARLSIQGIAPCQRLEGVKLGGPSPDRCMAGWHPGFNGRIGNGITARYRSDARLLAWDWHAQTRVMGMGDPMDATVRTFVRRSMVVLVATISPKSRPFMTPLWFLGAATEAPADALKRPPRGRDYEGRWSYPGFVDT